MEVLTDTLDNPTQERIQNERVAPGLRVPMKNLVSALDADNVNR